jgi:hypothetical protein
MKPSSAGTPTTEMDTFILVKLAEVDVVESP